MGLKKYVVAWLFLLEGIMHTLGNAKLIIVRHGEGEHNLLHTYSTWTQEEGGIDHPLTEKGKQQVAKTAEKLLEQGFNKDNVSVMLVSPLRRTRETAKVLVEYGLCSEKSIMIDERIREPRAQDWEGASTPPRKLGEDRWQAIVDASALHGGETTEAIRKRVENLFIELSMSDLSQGHAIVVTHGYPSQVLLQICGEENILLETAEARVLSVDLLRK